MRVVGAILAFLVAAFLGLGAVANFVPSCTTFLGSRVCVNDPGRGILFAAVAVVFLVFGVMALRSRKSRPGISPS